MASDFSMMCISLTWLGETPQMVEESDRVQLSSIGKFNAEESLE